MPFFENAESFNIIDSSLRNIAGNHTSIHYSIHNEGNFHGNINADNTHKDSDSTTPLDPEDNFFGTTNNAWVRSRGDPVINIQRGAHLAIPSVTQIIDYSTYLPGDQVPVQDLEAELAELRAVIQVKRTQHIRQRDKLAAEVAGAQAELAMLNMYE